MASNLLAAWFDILNIKMTVIGSSDVQRWDQYVNLYSSPETESSEVIVLKT